MVLLANLLLIITTMHHPANAQSIIIGTWKMEKVYEYDVDVSEKHNPLNDRWIELKADGTFTSDGTPFGRNTGRWTFNADTSTLFIDSDVDDDDSEWRVSFDGDDTLIWTGIGHPRKENTKLIHIRKLE